MALFALWPTPERAKASGQGPNPDLKSEREYHFAHGMIRAWMGGNSVT